MLSIKECSALRGVAILAIALHNFCHCLPDAPQENEFWFSAENNLLFWNTLQIEQTFIQLFAFWGHLGVPVFVFLSGYGLAVRYNSSTCEWKHFLWRHYKKLLIPMIIGTLLYQMILVILLQNTSDPLHLLLQISLFQNILPHSMSVFSPGPYWYFGMTLQLYILFAIFKNKPPMYILLFALFFLIMQFFLQDHHYSLVWLKYNSLGWLSPFIIGIFLGKATMHYSFSKRLFQFTLATSFILLILFGFQYYIWLLIPIIIPVFAISLVKVSPSVIIKPMILIGDISLYIFVVHPIIRQLTIPLAQNINPYISLLIYISLTIYISFFAKSLVKYLKTLSPK